MPNKSSVLNRLAFMSDSDDYDSSWQIHAAVMYVKLMALIDLAHCFGGRIQWHKLRLLLSMMFVNACYNIWYDDKAEDNVSFKSYTFATSEEILWFWCWSISHLSCVVLCIRLLKRLILILLKNFVNSFIYLIDSTSEKRKSSCITATDCDCVKLILIN